MNVRRAAQLLAGGRVALGVGLLVAPRRVARGWVGDHSQRPAVQALARSVGARDAVLGLIALHTLDHDQVGQRWLRTCAAVDLVDLAATVAAAGDLPDRGVAGTAALAGGAALAGLVLASLLGD